VYIKSHPPRLSSFCTVRPVFASQRLDLRTFRRSDVLFPAPASGPQVLLLSKLKAPLNHAESTLLQVFFLKNLKPFEITTYEKPGEGSPLWLTNCSKRVSARKDRWIPSLPSSVPSSKFRIPQVLCLPARRGGPLLRKHPGVWGYFSHSGTLRLFSLPPEWSYGISFSPFAFPDVRTFRPSDASICRWW